MDLREQYEDLRKQYLDSAQMEIWEKSNILYKTLFYCTQISKKKPDLEYSRKAVDSYMKLPFYKKWSTKYNDKNEEVRLIIPSNEPNKEPVEIAADIMTGWWYPFKYFMRLDEWSEMGDAIKEFRDTYGEKKVNKYIRYIYLNKLYKLQAIDSDEDTLVEWMAKKSKHSRESCQACLEFLKVVYTEGNMIPIIKNFHPGKSLDGWDYKMINIVDEGYNTAQAEKWRAYVKTYFEDVDNFVKANLLEDYYVNGKVLLLWSKDKPFNGFCEANEEEWKEYFTNAKERIVKRNEKLKKYD